MRKLRTVTTLVALAFSAGVVWLLVKTPSPDSVLRLLANAYSENRTLEVRIPGSKHTSIKVERGVSAPSSRPELLIQANLSISKYAHQHLGDPLWLHAVARNELLEQNFDLAIQHLQHAREIRGDAADLLIDMASAYFGRAQTRNQPLDYGNAIEILGEALATAPNDPVALFNRAVVCEKLFLYEQAQQDWEHYLQVDFASGWATEARERLAKVRNRVRTQTLRSDQPLLRFSQVASLRSTGRNSFSRIDDRLEEYLQKATTEWLPIAYPESYSNTFDQKNARSALRIIATWTRLHHRDDWLSDLLAHSSSSHFPGAVKALSRLLEANDAGNSEAAQTYAQEADSAFTAVQNLPGSLRARVENVFATHVAQEGTGCLAAAASFRNLVESRTYSWLRIQFHLEEGTCYWLKGNMGAARSLYNLAAIEAQQSDYKVLYLRTQDHIAALDCNTGKFDACWERIHNALDLYWNGSYPAMRAYNLYYNLHESARNRKKPFLQIAAWRDGLRLSDAFHDNPLRAMAHSIMANAASVSGDQPAAENELSIADRLFNLAPQTNATLVARLEARARLTEVEIKLGKFSEASRDLHEIEPRVASLSDNFLSLLFYANLGEAESRLHHGLQAESALRSAISFAESDLQSLKDERARLEWSQRSSGAYRNLVDLKLREGDVSGALEIWEWFRGASLRSRRAHPGFSGTATSAIGLVPFGKAESGSYASLPELHSVSEHLAALKTQTVVSYVRLRESYFVWVYDERGIFGYRIQTAPENIDSLARNFRQLCSDPSSDFETLKRQGRQLYNSLIAPIQGHLSRDRILVVEDDDALMNLAFVALRDEHDDYLSDRFSIVSSMGFYYGLRVRGSLPITSRSQILIAAVSQPSTVIGDGLPALPQVITEARDVASNFRTSELLEGTSATMAAVRSLIAESEIFHFGGHASALPGQTGLLLSDGILTYDALAKANLSRLQLTVLSACDTVGAIEGSDGNPESMARLFTIAGVPRVIASRWNVDSEQTKDFMEKFYGALVAKESAVAALNRAQSRVRTKKDTKHPYYWAAFTEFGVN